MFERYDVEGRVGTGATSTVWKAIQRDIGRVVAIKELGGSFVDDEAALARFRREAQLLASFDHPNIVRVYDFVEEPGRAWLVEEWVNGSGLDAIVRRGRLTPEQALGVLRGALLGLAHAHAAGVVHGDLHPANVLVDEQGVSRLVDFGLAAPVDGSGADRRDTRGTPGYIDPALFNRTALDPTVDVYSAGVLLYELLAGRRLFVGGSPSEVIAAQLQHRVPDVSGIGPRLNDLIQRATSVRPEQRPADAAAFLAELEEAARERYGAGWLQAAGMAGIAGVAGTAVGTVADASPSGDGEVGDVQVVVQAVAAAVPDPDVVVSTATRRRRVPRWAAGVAVAAVASIGVVAFVAASSDDSRPRDALDAGADTGAAPASAPDSTSSPAASSSAPASSTTDTTAVAATVPTSTTATSTTAPLATGAHASTPDATTGPSGPPTTPAASVVHLVASAAASNVTIIPADPNATATFNGPLPVYPISIDCSITECSLEIGANTETPTFVAITANHAHSVSETADTCSGSQGTEYTRTITSTFDVDVSGATVVGGVTVPISVSGVLQIAIPEAGLVPHVGEAIDNGAETGCTGQTMVITVQGELVPA